MAQRKRKTELTQSWKDKIQASVLGLRLYQHALGEVEMSPTQIKAAQIILAKLIPDLARTEIANPEGESFKTAAVVEFVKAR